MDNPWCSIIMIPITLLLHNNDTNHTHDHANDNRNNSNGGNDDSNGEDDDDKVEGDGGVWLVGGVKKTNICICS